MYKCVDITKLNDYFNEYSTRNPQGVYFYRINGFNENIKTFIVEYFKKAEKYGAVIETKIQNPTEKNLEYYEEIMGSDFSMNKDFIFAALKKWIPEINDSKIKALASSMYDIFEKMKLEGKNINMIKNAYIKFMCWIYYKFKRVISLSGENNIPKIIYQGNISMYELKFLSVLAGLGCDILLLQYEGDMQYNKLDPKSYYSKEYKEPNMTTFPKEFSIAKIRNEIHLENAKSKAVNISSSAYKHNNSENKSDIKRGTNIWLTGDIFSDVIKNPLQRGPEKDIYYNCFARIAGTEDKSMYVSELYNFYIKLKENNRRVYVCDNDLGIPSVEEISKIKRGMYSDAESMAFDISKNINYNIDKELCSIIRRQFIDIIIEESKKINGPINRVINKAVYILCWLNRFVYELYKNTDYKNLPVFIYFGDCENENQCLFLRFFSMLPLDVIIISPNIDKPSAMKDNIIFEKKFTYSGDLKAFPKENVSIKAGTAAYHAERELDNIMYNDSGMYRNRQYDKADSISLNTMYEEIYILWEQELKYRPNFQTIGDTVKMPVIYAKVSGVKDNNIDEYWRNIKKLSEKNAYVINKAPFVKGTDYNPVKHYATEFFKNGKLLKDKIKSHQAYPYKFIRDEIQDHILNKLETLINSKIIKGTFQNGTEYTIISTVLNINKEILRMIQNFDFTKLNPKIIFINTSEKTYSLEDAILTAFLNLVGFDIVFFIPTGYKGVEFYFNECDIEEHQIGSYVYDLPVPDLNKISSSQNRSLMDIIFKRGS